LNTKPNTMTPSPERRGIQSIEVGGALLQALVSHGAPMGLKDLAQAAGMPAAKAHPYLVSFGHLGLVTQDDVSGRYGLGPFALHMGLAALHALDPIKAAIPAAAELADTLRMNIAVAVWGNMGPTVVHIEEYSEQIHVNMRPGTVMTPLLLTATGQCFAAFLPPRVAQPLIDAEVGRQACGTQGQLRLSAAQANTTLSEVRQHGLSRAVGHPIPGINALSAPVFNSTGHIALAITAMGPATEFDAAWEGQPALALARCARALSQRLGCDR
jgi:DNA-binding IclR family transcriptional regulator